MKNLALKASSLVFLLSLHVSKALAQGSSPIFGPGFTPPDVVNQEDLPSSVTRLINSILTVLGLVAVAFIIYAGVLMVTAGGNDEQVGKARKIITYAVVGLIIIFLSYAIVNFVDNLL